MNVYVLYLPNFYDIIDIFSLTSCTTQTGLEDWKVPEL